MLLSFTLKNIDNKICVGNQLGDAEGSLVTQNNKQTSIDSDPTHPLPPAVDSSGAHRSGI